MVAAVPTQMDLRERRGLKLPPCDIPDSNISRAKKINAFKQELSEDGKIAQGTVKRCIDFIIKNNLLTTRQTPEQICELGISMNLAVEISSAQRKVNSIEATLTSVVDLPVDAPSYNVGRTLEASDDRAADAAKIVEQMLRDHVLLPLSTITTTLNTHCNLYLEVTAEQRKLLWEALTNTNLVTYNWGFKNHSVRVSIRLDGPTTVLKIYNTGAGSHRLKDGKVRPTEYNVPNFDETIFNKLLVAGHDIQSAKEMYSHVENVLGIETLQIISKNPTTKAPQKGPTCSEKSLKFLIKDLIYTLFLDDQDKKRMYLDYKMKDIKVLLERLETDDTINTYESTVLLDRFKKKQALYSKELEALDNNTVFKKVSSH
ncbi:hypothetical protein DID80_07580 [Candidatus Marinamargulisbacteria bacterium SCGC AAA071-K20]|nr:hypothetical protein DID80_07580 [Candidatus Marinamargulisbacteria bacterium SCGC AAA071-K20]